MSITSQLVAPLCRDPAFRRIRDSSLEDIRDQRSKIKLKSTWLCPISIHLDTDLQQFANVAKVDLEVYSI